MKKENFYKASELDYSIGFYKSLLAALSEEEFKTGQITGLLREIGYGQENKTERLKPFIDALKKTTEDEIAKLETEFEAL